MNARKYEEYLVKKGKNASVCAGSYYYGGLCDFRGIGGPCIGGAVNHCILFYVRNVVFTDIVQGEQVLLSSLCTVSTSLKVA